MYKTTAVSTAVTPTNQASHKPPQPERGPRRPAAGWTRRWSGAATVDHEHQRQAQEAGVPESALASVDLEGNDATECDAEARRTHGNTRHSGQDERARGEERIEDSGDPRYAAEHGYGDDHEWVTRRRIKNAPEPVTICPSCMPSLLSHRRTIGGQGGYKVIRFHEYRRHRRIWASTAVRRGRFDLVSRS